MAYIGQELKRERELRGISLKEISDATKINLRFLRALEEDQLDVLPEKFFTKSIIRAYAKYVGLEEDTVLNNYYETALLQKQTLEDEEEKKEVFRAIPRKKKNLLIFALISITFLAILICLYFIFQKKENSIPVETLPPPTFSQRNISPPPATEPEEEEYGLNLEISFQQKTWLQVYADGEIKLNGIKQPGELVQIRALEEFLIHLGNAGGITYTLNNKRGRKLGVSGAVVKNVRITIDNIQQFLDLNDGSDSMKKI